MPKLKRTKKRKLWSVPRISHPKFPGYALRVTELVAGGDLYFVRMIEGKQRMALLRPRCTRLDLGRNEQEQKQGAYAKAFEIIEALAADKDADAAATAAGAPLTLATLADLYELHGLHGTGANYKRDQVSKLRRFSAFLGAERRVISLCKSDIRRFEAHRLKGGVRGSTVHGDLDALKIACSWATEHKRADGQTLLDRNPLAKVRVQRDEPRRPWATPERYERLQGVADQLPPPFGVVLSVAWESGHRLGAILALKWRDIDFATSELSPNGSIRWYADVRTTKKARDHRVPMTVRAAAALTRWRQQGPNTIGATWVFPALKNLAKPLGHHVAKRWLRKAEELARLEHEAGGGWHMFRRGWATKRKGLSVKDVMAAGGWRDTPTLIRSYMHADPETILAVVNF